MINNLKYNTLNLKQIQKKKTKVILNYCYNFAAIFEEKGKGGCQGRVPMAGANGVTPDDSYDF